MGLLFLRMIFTFVRHNIMSFHVVFWTAPCINFKSRLPIVCYKRWIRQISCMRVKLFHFGQLIFTNRLLFIQLFWMLGLLCGFEVNWITFSWFFFNQNIFFPNIFISILFFALNVVSVCFYPVLVVHIIVLYFFVWVSVSFVWMTFFYIIFLTLCFPLEDVIHGGIWAA